MAAADSDVLCFLTDGCFKERSDENRGRTRRKEYETWETNEINEAERARCAVGVIPGRMSAEPLWFGLPETCSQLVSLSAS